MPQTPDSPWLDIAGAAAYLGLSARQVGNLAREGKLTGVKTTDTAHGHWRFHRENDLDAYLERHRIGRARRRSPAPA